MGDIGRSIGIGIKHSTLAEVDHVREYPCNASESILKQVYFLCCDCHSVAKGLQLFWWWDSILDYLMRAPQPTATRNMPCPLLPTHLCHVTCWIDNIPSTNPPTKTSCWSWKLVKSRDGGSPILMHVDVPMSDSEKLHSLVYINDHYWNLLYRFWMVH